ncbi:ABC-three component system middle component 7 [Neptuniibacter sp. SY11_33]|uniref:ABC-three component system middle component 7 n=1 Tax=Neptuniibacter sp. SY11_33 TaxID=3398215 RepID=UPI0039F4EEDD
MLVPNKTISINESCLFRSAILLSKLKTETSVIELYQAEKRMFLDMSDFIDVLDLLFILGKVVLDEDSGVIKHA